MTTFYLDLVNGNDANDGSSWANAWKTINLGATAARIAPSDTIRIAKSPDPTSIGSATWTNLSRTVTLAGACTADVCECESAWTGSTNVTATAYQDYANKYGTYQARMVIDAAFTTGKVAYFAFTSKNLSAYQQLSLWFKSGSLWAANTFKVCLCSDSAGVTIVDEFIIPALPTGANPYWAAFTINKGSNLGTGIQSIALYAIADPGAVTVYLDNIIACKAAGSADSLSLTSLISKNSAANGGTEGWWPIKSIDGTTVILDQNTECVVGAGRGYYGTSESVTSYKRETIKIGTTSDGNIMDSGTAGNLISFLAGYNTGNTTQDGQTFLDGVCGTGNILDYGSRSYVKTDRISTCRGITGVNMGAGNHCEYYGHTHCGHSSDVFYVSGSNSKVVVESINANHQSYVCIGINNYVKGCDITAGSLLGSGYGMTISNSVTGTRIAWTRIANCANSGLMVRAIQGNTFIGGFIKSCVSYGLYIYSDNDSANFYHDIVTDLNGTSGLYVSGSSRKNNFRNCTFNEASNAIGNGLYAWEATFTLEKYAGVLTDNRTYGYGFMWQSQTTTRHTASGVAWEIKPQNESYVFAEYPVRMPIAQIAVAANAQVTVTCWFRRSNTGISAALTCRGRQLSGVDNDVSTAMSAAQDTWERLTIQFTPTEAGVVEIEAWVYGGTTYSVFVDDMDVSQ